MLKSNKRSKNLAFTALFVALIIVGVFVRIPIPYMPFTLQTLFAGLAGLMLGPLYGAIAIIIYIVLGLIGLPIFTFGGGFSSIFMPSFGYTIGFLVGVIAEGLIIKAFKHRKLYVYLIASVAFVIIEHIIGIFYFYIITAFYLHDNVTAQSLLVNLVLLFIGPDLLKGVIASICAYKLVPIFFTAKIAVTEGVVNAPTEETVSDINSSDEILIPHNNEFSNDTTNCSIERTTNSTDFEDIVE